MKKYQQLFDLINFFGVSGKEMFVRDYLTKGLKKLMKGHKGCGCSLKVDKMGNLIAHKKGKRPRIMIAAHMDEIGLIVKNIEADGKIRLSTIGGIDEIVLLNERVRIKTRTCEVPGVVTTDDISSSRIVHKIPTLPHMYLDTGLTKKELIKKNVHIGSFISFLGNAQIIGDGKIISGKALDDRIGCYVLLELAKKIRNFKNEIFLVFTVQEEVGLYGAKTSSFHIDPDWAVAFDVTDCDDCDKSGSKHLGSGPTLTIKDAEMISSPRIDDKILKLAKKAKIKLQPDVSDAGTTDAMNISISRAGVPTAVLGVPVRSLHTPVSYAHLDDIDNAIKLLGSLLKNPPDIRIK